MIFVRPPGQWDLVHFTVEGMDLWVNSALYPKVRVKHAGYLLEILMAAYVNGAIAVPAQNQSIDISKLSKTARVTVLKALGIPLEPASDEQRHATFLASFSGRAFAARDHDVSLRHVTAHGPNSWLKQELKLRASGQS